MLQIWRSFGCVVTSFVVALAVGLASLVTSAPPASATTVTAMTQAYNPPPSPLTVLVTPLTVGMHVIEAIAEGIADAVEKIATPPPVAIPAPHTRA